MDPVADQIAELIEPSLAAMGFDLVRVQLSGSKTPRCRSWPSGRATAA